jgi:hypothetical protein
LNPFDDAVRDLMAQLPADTDLGGVRKHVRRHRRHRALTALVILSAISGASVGVAASLGRKSSGPTVAVSPSTTDAKTTTTTTITTSVAAECGSSTSETMTVFDHGTHRPIQLNSAYYCRRVEDLNPPKGSHLTGTIYVSDGKVVATYYRLKDVMSVRPDGVVVDTGAAGTDPVPTAQLPPSLQRALRTP